MTPTAPHYDAIVVGAGPAGCGVARLLAAWKHRVLLVDRPGPSRPLAESIPPSAQKALAALGMLASVEDAGFRPWLGNTVWWANDEPRVEPLAPGEAGYHVLRSRFDDRLRALAAEAGADVRAGFGREVRVPGLAGDPQGDAPPSVAVEVEGRISRATATFIIDCSGRAGVIARQGLRRADASPHTIALVGVWHAARPWPVASAAHTLVASHEDGWAWSVPTEAGVRYITVMVDPQRTPLTRGGSARAVYLEELAKVGPFRPLLDDAVLADGPWGADASLYTATQYAGRGFLLVGDAGSFIDPLSSFGVKKALASAWLAAVAVHTCLEQPAMGDEALAFFDRREHELHASAGKQAAEFARDVAARTNHPFWLARAAAPDAFDPDAADTAALARDPMVVAAFDQLRRRPSIRLHRGADLRIGPRAAVRGREIVRDEHIFLPAWPTGVRYLRNIDLLSLIRLAPKHDDVGALYEAFSQAHGSVALPDFLGALSVLLARGALRHAPE